MNQLKQKWMMIFRSKQTPYQIYKQHCSCIRAVLSADPGFVTTNMRHDHIVEQRIILNRLIK
jgi:hypothetical protein